MKYKDFKNQVRLFPVFSGSQLTALNNSNKQVLRNQLTKWVAQEQVIRLRKNLYILTEHDRAINPSKLFLGNQIYAPSYISCESALEYHGLIPEKVYDITSVTTKKTMTFSSKAGVYRYQHLKPESFFGFTAQKDKSNLPIFIASAEKALIDFIYLNLHRFPVDNLDIFDKSYRLQNLESVSANKLKMIARRFNNKKFKKVINNLCLYIKESG